MLKNLLITLLFLGVAEVAHAQARLVFSHNTAGDQTLRRYCAGPCAQARSADNAMAADTKTGLAAVRLAPNPTTGIVNVHWQGQPEAQGPGQPARVAVTDMAGRALPVSITVGGQAAQADLSALPTGIYLVRLRLPGRKPLVKRIAKH